MTSMQERVANLSDVEKRAMLNAIVAFPTYKFRVSLGLEIQVETKVDAYGLEDAKLLAIEGLDIQAMGALGYTIKNGGIVTASAEPTM